MILHRTTKRGGMPTIAYAKRNLEPLGTEFKNIVGGFQGHMV